MPGRLNHRPISRSTRNISSSSASVGNNGTSESTTQTRKAKTPRSKTGSGDRLEEIDRPVIIPVGIRWEKHPYSAREPSTVQGALVRKMYPEPIGPADNKKPVLTWEDYKWSSNPQVQTAASRIKEEFWWRFKCNPSDQREADEVLEDNLTEKVRQMIYEEKKAAFKRLYKRGNVAEEEDEEGNRWPTIEALISAKPADFGTNEGWCLLCEYWSTPKYRNKSLSGKRNRLANGDTIYHCSGARSIVSTRQYLKRKTGKDPGLAGAWHHTHKLQRGTDRGQLCSQKTADRWERFDNAMENTHGPNWEDEHPELDGAIIYETAGRMPHGRLGIANEAFSKTEKSIIKSRRMRVSQPVQSASANHLVRENNRLRRENNHYRGMEHVLRALASKGGLDFDALMQEATPELATSDSEGGFARRHDRVGQDGIEPGIGSNTGGNNPHEDHDINVNEDDINGDDEYDDINGVE